MYAYEAAVQHGQGSSSSSSSSSSGIALAPLDLEEAAEGSRRRTGRDGSPAALAALAAGEGRGAPEGPVAVAAREQRPTKTDLSRVGGGDALEGRFLAQIKKSKDLTVQLESERTKSRKLQEQLNALSEKADKLARQLQAEGHTKRRTAAVAAAAGGAKVAEGSGAADEAGSDTAGQLAERLERAYNQVRERDVQVSEAKREVAQLKGILARELGKTPEELHRWLGSAPGNKEGKKKGGGGGGVEAPDGWRSRAEQIVLLKGKLKDMERVLASYHSNEEPLAARAHPGAGSDRGGEVVDGGGRVASQRRQPLTPEEVAALVAEGGDDVESLLLLAHQTCPLGGTSPSKAEAEAAAKGRSGGDRDSHGGVPTPSLTSASAMTAARTAAAASTAATSKRDVDDDARDAIGALAGKRLKGLREAEAELAKAQEIAKNEKAKQVALQARLVSLQRENTQLRSHIQVMLEKSKSDDELVAAYREELEEATRAMLELKGDLAEQRQEEEAAAAHARPHALPKGEEASYTAAFQALEAENKALKARVRAAELTPSQPRSTGQTYEERIAHWTREAAAEEQQQQQRQGGEGPDKTSPSTAPSSLSPSAVGLLRAAHAHIFLLEKRLSQLGNDHSRSGGDGSGALPPPQAALLMENASLRERVKSLTELLKKEAQAQKLIV